MIKVNEVDEIIDEIIDEIDEPINGMVYPEQIYHEKNTDNLNLVNQLENKKLDYTDKNKDRELFKFNKGNKLLYICLGILTIIIIPEFFGVDIKENINSLIEVLKAIIFTLIGYLFTKKDN